MTDNRTLARALSLAALACLLAVVTWPMERAVSVAEILREGAR